MPRQPDAEGGGGGWWVALVRTWLAGWLLPKGRKKKSAACAFWTPGWPGPKKDT